jgi:hypothetical protein
MAGSTGFEPATSGLTVQCANQAAPRARVGTSATYTTRFHDARAADLSHLQSDSIRRYLAHGRLPARDHVVGRYAVPARSCRRSPHQPQCADPQACRLEPLSLSWQRTRRHVTARRSRGRTFGLTRPSLACISRHLRVRQDETWPVVDTHRLTQPQGKYWQYPPIRSSGRHQPWLRSQMTFNSSWV